jgi:uroporphyrinogen-III decarboxylase
MTSRERMLAALSGEKPDHTPCSFMLFLSLARHCRSDAEYVERQVALGLDAFVNVARVG